MTLGAGARLERGTRLVPPPGPVVSPLVHPRLAVVAGHVPAPPVLLACRCGEKYTRWPTPYQTPRVAGP